jgi:hypothetical protein
MADGVREDELERLPRLGPSTRAATSVSRDSRVMAQNEIPCRRCDGLLIESTTHLAVLEDGSRWPLLTCSKVPTHQLAGWNERLETEIFAIEPIDP